MFLLQPNGSGGSTSTPSATTSRSIGESVLVAGDSRAAQGPRPQRAAGPRHRLRAGPRRTRAGSASRTSTTRRATSARRGRRPSPAEAARRHSGTAAARPRRPRSAVVAVVAGDGLAAIFRDFGVAAVVHGGQIGQPEHRRAARGDHGRRRPRGHRPAEQPERGPRRAPGRRHGRSAGRRRPDTQRRRGLRRPPRARSEPRRDGQRRAR